MPVTEVPLPTKITDAELRFLRKCVRAELKLRQPPQRPSDVNRQRAELIRAFAKTFTRPVV